MTEDLATYLRLAPEFGGTRFGPFEGLEVRLGSDEDRCHIVLPEALGVLPEHAKIIRQGPQNLILAPSERTAAVFLWKQGARRPTQVLTPTAVRAGDAFSLVTPDGPRFIVEIDELPPEIKAQREEERRRKRRGVGRGRLTAESMKAELKRQAWTRLLVMGPMQMAQRAWVFVQSGAIWQPRYIILGITIASGWLFGGMMSCRSRKHAKQLQSVQVELESCTEERSIVEKMAKSRATELKFSELATAVLRSTRIGAALDSDSELRGAVRRHARALFASAEAYSWLLRRSTAQAGQFARWRELVADSDLDENTKLLVTWLAATPRRSGGEWDQVTDSEGNDVCGRGVLRMTFRQAVHLGLSAQPDYLHVGRASAIEEKARREELLDETLARAGLDPIGGGQSFETDVVKVMNGAGYCLFLQGDDDRTRRRVVLRALERRLGPDAPDLPPTSAASAAPARIARFFAADVVGEDYARPGSARLLFGADAPVSGTIAATLDRRGQWVLDRTAETIARAIALPCAAVLEGHADRAKELLGEENLPNPVHCLVLNWKLQHSDSGG